MGYFGVTKKELKKQIQALEEGQRDIMNSLIIQTTGLSQNNSIRKNNYKTYASQIAFIHQAYDGALDYGSSLVGPIIDTRVALIAGEGISLFCEKEATKKYLQSVIDNNKLNGSRLISIVTGCEMDGKNLLVILPDKKGLKIREMSYYNQNYTITVDEKDNDKIIKVEYKDDSGNTKPLPEDKIVYINTSGIVNKKNNDTPPKIAKVLTQIENYDRAHYDLRANNHLFGKLMPYWETADDKTAQKINNAIDKKQWEIGKGYAGTAKFSIVGPPTGASATIKDEMSITLKMISSAVNIPVHWMGWVDLMSNRATAEELREMLAMGVKKERLILVEKLYELFDKCMEIGVDTGIEGAVNDPDGYTIDLPILTMDQLKALNETWIPLMDADIVSRQDVQNRVPGIDPAKTDEAISKDKEKRMQDFAGNLDNMKNDKMNNQNAGGNFGNKNPGKNGQEQKNS